MKTWITLSIFLICYFIYGFYIYQFDLSVVPKQLRKENPHGYYDYKGVINVHTDLSLGSARPLQVIAAAKAANLDFIVLTDLNVFQDMTNLEGYHGNTLVFVGNKVSYLDSRLIYYSLKNEPLGSTLGESQVKIADLLSQNIGANKDSLLILAHPFKAGFSWNGDIPSGLDGFEILNIKSLSNRAWEMSKISTMWSLLTYPFNNKLALLRLASEPSEELNLLDQLSQSRTIVGYAGAEASARAIPLANYLIKFPSYQRSFELFTNHVLLKSELTGNTTTDKQKIFSALKSGQFYLSFDLIGDPKGFNAYIEDNKGRVYPMGSQIKYYKGLSLKVRIPVEPLEFFEVVLYRNGIRHDTFNSSEVDIPITEAGSYRIQVRVSPLLPLPDAKKWITWIYTNPFFVVP
jgi:hypothetical protein